MSCLLPLRGCGNESQDKHINKYMPMKNNMWERVCLVHSNNSLTHPCAGLNALTKKKKVPLYKKQSYPPNDDFIDVAYFSAVPCTSFLDACQFCTRQVVKHILIRSKHTELMQKRTEDRGMSIDTKTQTRGQTHTLSLSLSLSHTHTHTHTHTHH